MLRNTAHWETKGSDSWEWLVDPWGGQSPAHMANHHRLEPELWLPPPTPGLSPLCHQAQPAAKAEELHP